MDLSIVQQQLTDVEKATRMRERHCLYYRGLVYLAQECPNKASH
jgi:hypothetical protein